MPGLSFQVDNCPVFLMLLDVAEVQLNCFVATHAASQQHGQEGTITLFFQAFAAWSLPKLL